jgi:EmrB/QacA subfamily drug resistance transporter
MVSEVSANTSRTFVLVAAILGSSITFIDGSVINVALPVLQDALDATVDQVQWVVESYALMVASLMLVGGSLGDRLGRRSVFIAGTILFGIASVWCGLTSTIEWLIIARAVQGIGAALLVPGSLALITAAYDEEHRGRAIGTWSGFTAIAAGAGPVLGGWLIEQFSWRWIFFINIPLVIAVLAITMRGVPESRDETARGPIDWLGAALATLGLGGLVYGLIEAGTGGIAQAHVIASIAGGIVALIAFIVVEARLRNPMMPLELFRSSTFAGANLLTLLLYAALGGLLFFLPFNLIELQRYTPTEAGAAVLPFVITMFLLSRWSGGLVARFGSKLPLVVGPLVTAVGFAMFALPGASPTSYWTSFFPAIMVMSLGMTIAVAPLTTTVMSAVDERRAGVASGINNEISRAASLLAVAAFGVVMLATFTGALDERLDRAQIAPEAKRTILERRSQFVAMDLPPSLDAASTARVEAALREAFVDGFRVVSWVAAGLAAASALVAWGMIDGKGEQRT